MFNPKILKKKMKESEMNDPEENMPQEAYETSEESETYSKPLHIGKKAMHHAMAAMAPKGVMEKEKEDMEEEDKKILPQSKIEIELMINGAKKKKKG